VAFVSSVSMLVRRDLLRGLGGIDQKLAPVAAGLDLSQRVRVAGGRVIVVPSSEVFHDRRCGRGDGGWREQSGRMRAMLKAYRPITLIWMVPLAILTGIADSLIRDRKSTRLNSSHVKISYAVFCLKKKKICRSLPALN